MLERKVLRGLRDFYRWRDKQISAWKKTKGKGFILFVSGLFIFTLIIAFDLVVMAAIGAVAGFIAVVVLGGLMDWLTVGFIRDARYQDLYMRRANFVLLIIGITYICVYAILARTHQIGPQTPFLAMAGFFLFIGYTLSFMKRIEDYL